MAKSSKRFFVNNLSDLVPEPGFLSSLIPFLKERIDKLVQQILANQPKTHSACDGGLYVGLSGIAYMFYHISKHADGDKKAEFLQLANEYISAQISYEMKHLRNPEDKAGFLLGAAGTNALSAALNHHTGLIDARDAALQELAQGLKACESSHFLSSIGGDELFVGRAGFLCGTLWLQREVGSSLIAPSHLGAIYDAIVSSGQRYSAKHHSKSPLMYAYHGTEYLGAAHGLSSILQILLSFPDLLKQHPEKELLVKQSVDFLLELQQPNGNFPTAMDELAGRRPESEELVHWCHGAPGVVHLMARAYMIWKDDKYLQSCLRCGELVWQKGLLKKGPGLCHGIAGNGYVFLLLYRLTKDTRHLHRASEFAKFMFTEDFQKHARTPDTPYSLYEGLAGAVCFLTDLLKPEKASFPFFDIF